MNAKRRGEVEEEMFNQEEEEEKEEEERVNKDECKRREEV